MKTSWWPKDVQWCCRHTLGHEDWLVTKYCWQCRWELHQVLVSSLWCIDPCCKQCVECSIHLPPVLDSFEVCNDWKAKKEEKPSGFVWWAIPSFGPLDATCQAAMNHQTFFQTASWHHRYPCYVFRQPPCALETADWHRKAEPIITNYS